MDIRALKSVSILLSIPPAKTNRHMVTAEVHLKDEAKTLGIYMLHS